MTPNPFSALLHSRKFWLLMLDGVVSAALYFTAKYMSASASDDIKVLIALMQPVFVVVIGAIAYEDKAALQAGGINVIAREDKAAPRAGDNAAHRP